MVQFLSLSVYNPETADLDLNCFHLGSSINGLVTDRNMWSWLTFSEVEILQVTVNIKIEV